MRSDPGQGGPAAADPSPREGPACRRAARRQDRGPSRAIDFGDSALPPVPCSRAGSRVDPRSALCRRRPRAHPAGAHSLPTAAADPSHPAGLPTGLLLDGRQEDRLGGPGSKFKFAGAAEPAEPRGPCPSPPCSASLHTHPRDEVVQLKDVHWNPQLACSNRLLRQFPCCVQPQFATTFHRIHIPSITYQCD